mmetsp:Transcript_33715/g.86464  ORF Transcript_33715/g.86464 Transcript_33715/m.86464 type:complete len:90 (-) Transcript_33715:2647-2916(-)
MEERKRDTKKGNIGILNPLLYHFLSTYPTAFFTATTYPTSLKLDIERGEMLDRKGNGLRSPWCLRRPDTNVLEGAIQLIIHENFKALLV